MGISNGNHSMINQTIQEQVGRKKRSIGGNILLSPTSTFNGSEKIRTRRFEINRHVYERQVLRMKRQRNAVKREAPLTPPKTLKLPYEIVFQNTDKIKSKKLKSNQNFMQKVSVVIHNVVHGDEDKDVIDTNKIDVPTDRSNLTEIIYSVIVNGKPILASTAADDMRLVKLDEVVKIMENDIFLKAERRFKQLNEKRIFNSFITNCSISQRASSNTFNSILYEQLKCCRNLCQPEPATHRSSFNSLYFVYSSSYYFVALWTIKKTTCC